MDLIMLTLRSVANAITQPSLIIIFIVVGIMFYFKNKKISVMQKMIIGESIDSPLELTLSQIVLGVVAGAIGSLILNGLGVVFSERSGVEYIFLVSVFFMFIRPRFVCFSYSAAFLGGLSLILSIVGSGGILNVDIVMLMTFVGVLHIVEALLVMVDGSRGTVPVFTNKDGKILGGYALNRQWILPIAMLIAFSGMDLAAVAGETIPTPTGWPILQSPGITDNLSSLLLVMIPFFGVVGYSSVTFTLTKTKKKVSSGLFILLYGVVLCLVAQLASFGIVGQLVVLIFAPLSHEGMLLIQKRLEEKRKPVFVSDEGGLAVLEVIPHSIAYENGMRKGDKIVLVNNTKVNSEGEITTLIKSNFGSAIFLIKNVKGEVREVEIKSVNNKRLGYLLVPRFIPREDVVKFDTSKFSSVIDKIKREDNNKDIK